jgi:hypothetical protein
MIYKTAIIIWIASLNVPLGVLLGPDPKTSKFVWPSKEKAGPVMTLPFFPEAAVDLSFLFPTPAQESQPQQTRAQQQHAGGRGHGPGQGNELTMARAGGKVIGQVVQVKIVRLVGIVVDVQHLAGVAGDVIHGHPRQHHPGDDLQV